MPIGSAITLALLILFSVYAVFTFGRRVIEQYWEEEAENRRRRHMEENLFPDRAAHSQDETPTMRARLGRFTSPIQNKQARRMRRDPLIEPSPALPGLPAGKSVNDLYCEGMVDLRIHLIQQARKVPRMDLSPTRASTRTTLSALEDLDAA